MLFVKKSNDKSFHKNVNQFKAIFSFMKNLRLHNVQQDQIFSSFIIFES